MGGELNGFPEGSTETLMYVQRGAKRVAFVTRQQHAPRRPSRDTGADADVLRLRVSLSVNDRENRTRNQLGSR